MRYVGWDHKWDECVHDVFDLLLKDFWPCRLLPIGSSRIARLGSESGYGPHSAIHTLGHVATTHNFDHWEVDSHAPTAKRRIPFGALTIVHCIFDEGMDVITVRFNPPFFAATTTTTGKSLSDAPAALVCCVRRQDREQIFFMPALSADAGDNTQTMAVKNDRRGALYTISFFG